MSDILPPYGRARVAADDSRSGFPHAGTRGLFLVEDADLQLVPYIGHPTGAQTSFAEAAFYAAQRAQGIHWVTDPTYGAVGDGTTDDTTAVNAAITAASATGEGAVVIPANTFLVTQVTAASNVRVVGQGYKSRLHRAFTSTSQYVVLADGVSNFSIEHCRISGNVTAPGINSNRLGVALTGSSATGSGLTVSRCWFDGVDVGVRATGATAYVTITGNTFGANIDTAIQCGQGGALINSTVPSHYRVTDNNIAITGSSEVTACGIYLSGALRHATVRGNRISGTMKYGVQFYVTTTTSESLEDVVVSENQISGAAYNGILATNLGNTSYDIKDVTITGNHIRTSGQSGIYLRGMKESIVRGNRVTDSTQHGIAVVTVSSIIPTDVEVIGNAVNTVGADYDGIRLEGASHCTVADNDVKGATYVGIHINASIATEHVLVTGNRVRSATFGVFFNGSLNNYHTAQGNKFYNCAIHVLNPAAGAGSIKCADNDAYSTDQAKATGNWQAAVPANTGYFRVGDRVWNTATAAGGAPGWVCTTAGNVGRGAWTTGAAYTRGDVVTANSKTYVATTTGTAGATTPSHAAGSASDGAVTWAYVVNLTTAAVFKTMASVAA